MINGEELYNITKVWAIAIASLLYSYYVVRQLPIGIYRLVSLLPVFYLFITLPLILSSALLGGPTAGYLVWFGNFRLFLFAFNRGPLAVTPPLSLLLFLTSALTPVTTVIKSDVASDNQSSLHRFTNSYNSKVSGPVKFSIKFVVFAFLLWIYHFREYLHPSIIKTLYCALFYLVIEMTLLLSVAPIRAIVGVEIQPLFNEPYLSTSLQDFWGRRWNLMVTTILRPSVYDPIRSFFMYTLGQRWSSMLAFMASFLVSGLMHEICYYYLTRASPTWEVTWFFILHGACTACEVAVKKALNGRWQLHPVVSCLITIGFIITTAYWLFFPQLWRNNVDLKLKDECQSLARLLLFRTT